MNNIVDGLAVNARIKNNNMDIDSSYYEYYLSNNNKYVNAFHNELFNIKCDNQFHLKQKDHMGDHNILLLMNKTDAFLREMRLLSYNDAQAINRVRMGYMVLPENGNWIDNRICECSDNTHIYKLTVQHYFYECELFNAQRIELQNHLSELNMDFKNNDYFYNINNLLFPHLNYNIQENKNFETIINRVKILMSVALYCRYRFPD